MLQHYLSSKQVFNKNGEEVKLIMDTLTHSFASVSSTATGVSVSGTINGTDYYHRIGRTISMKEFHLSGILAGGQSGTIADDAYNAFRICLVERSVGSTPTVDLNAILDPRIVGGLIRVLYDKVYVLESPNPLATGYQAAIMPITIDVPLNHKQMYNGTIVSSMTGTEIALYMVSDSGSVVHPGFTSGQWIVAFSDL